MTPIYTNLARPHEIPEWEAKAAARGLVLDHWPLYPDRNYPVVVRFAASIEEKDEADAYRHLGLTPP